MNTKVNYMYRDASNYKIHLEAILIGDLTDKEIAEVILISALTLDGTPNEPITSQDIDHALKDDFSPDSIEDGYFFPGAIGLPSTTFVDEGYQAYDDDPEWHELTGITRTKEANTCEVTAAEFLEAFRNRKAITLPL